MELTLRASCPTDGDLVVRIEGLGDRHIADPLPEGRWRSVHTTETVSFSRQSSFVDMTFFGRCQAPKEDMGGVHRCLLDERSTCR